MPNYTGHRFGNYLLLHPLGQGGFAEVYLAEHVHLQTSAAAKILHGPITAHDMQAFTREARVIAHLDHPNIIRVIDFGVQENIPFLIMEYAINGTLRDRHPKGERIPLNVIVTYVRQLASALHYAHTQRIIHRDVKPANMLLGKQHEVLLGDFGVSAIVHSTNSQSKNSIAGTILYMAPEQIQRQAVPASDQYSLAVVVYEWLCGRPPFSGSTIEIGAKHCTTPPPSLRDSVPTLPAAVESVVLKALAKNPQQRFTHIQDFAQALEQASAGNVLPTWPLYSADSARTRLDESISSSSHAEPPTRKVSSAQSDRTDFPRTGLHLTRRTVIAGLAGAALIGGVSAVVLARASFFAQAGVVDTGTNKKPVVNPRQSPTSSDSSSPSPTLASPSVIYAGGTDAFLYALNLQDGSLLWSFHAGDWMNSRPVVNKGVVYAGSNDHSLYAFQFHDGSLLWRFQTDGKIVSWPMLANNVLYFGCWDAYVYALDVESRSLLWRYQTGDFISSPAQVVNGVVYIGSADAYLYAFQATTGTLLWRFRTGAPLASLATVSAGVVYVGSGDHFLYALRATDGRELWRLQTGDAIYSAPEIVDGILYIGSWDHSIYAVRIADHTILWRFQTGDKVASLPTVSEGVLYAGSSDGFFYALHAQDGATLWSYQTGGVISSKAMLVDGIVYVGGSNGLFALRASDGSLAWKFGNAAFTTPAFA